MVFGENPLVILLYMIEIQENNCLRVFFTFNGYLLAFMSLFTIWKYSTNFHVFQKHMKQTLCNLLNLYLESQFNSFSLPFDQIAIHHESFSRKEKIITVKMSRSSNGCIGNGYLFCLLKLFLYCLCKHIYEKQIVVQSLTLLNWSFTITWCTTYRSGVK